MHKNIDLVIARYKENIDWLDNISKIDSIKKIFIYEKFFDAPESTLNSNKIRISLPNLGRESNTYLHHIVENYDKLNDFTVFLQGDPSPHSHHLYQRLSFISKELNSIYPLSSIETEDENHRYRYHESHPHGLYLSYFMDLLFDITLDINQTVEVSYGAQFCVPKHIILSRPLDFYKYLLKIVSRKPNGIEPYIFERLWLYIFNPNIKISDSYKIWT